MQTPEIVLTGTTARYQKQTQKTKQQQQQQQKQQKTDAQNRLGEMSLMRMKCGIVFVVRFVYP